MDPADALLDWLNRAPPLREMTPEELRRYNGELAAVLADPERAGGAQPRYELTRRLLRLGDLTSALTLALALADSGAEAPVRLRAAGTAARCYYELGFFPEALALVQRAAAWVTPELIGFTPYLDNLTACTHHLAGDYAAAEHYYHRSLEQLAALPEELVLQGSGASRVALIHARLNNLADAAILRSRAETGERKTRTLDLAMQRITGGMSSRDCPRSTRAMYLNNYGVVLRERGELDEALDHFNALIGELQASPEQAWVLPTAYRDRALTKSRRGDRRAALEDLRLALATSTGLEERQSARDLVEAMGEMHSAAVAAHGAVERRALGMLRGEGQGLLHDLLQLLEGKDWQISSGALEKMAELAMRIHRGLDGALPGITPEVLEAGALLHDVGKLYIPWSLLNKLAPLNDWERGLLQSHTTEGSAILKRLGMAGASRVALDHHRHHGGGGYPEGDPPGDPHAAVVAVADAYTSMTLPTRMRETPKSPAEALAEIRRCAPAQFHPVVVAALERVEIG
jgi:tetratricopeptide (TPR) repeat protein